MVTLAAALVVDRRPVSAVTCPASMTFGDNIDCSISVGGEVDAYSFSGTSGDAMYVRIAKTATGGVSSPKVEIRRPDNSVLCFATGTYFATVSCALDTTGTHTVVAKSNSGTATGNYGLYGQVLGSLQNTTAATFGTSYTGSLTSATVAGYSVTAAAGDVLLARVGKNGSSGLASPRVEIWRPDGTSCTDASNSYWAAKTCSANAAGSYLVIVAANTTGSGAYGVLGQRLNNPGGTESTYGTSSTGTMTGAGEDYWVTAAAGDVLYARAAANGSAGLLAPRIEIWRPDGTSCTDSGNAYWAAKSCTATVAGTYVVVAAPNSNYTGAFGALVQRLNNPGGTESTYGTSSTGTMTGAGEDYWVTAAAGDVLYARVGKNGSAGLWAPRVEIWRPDGTSCTDSGSAYWAAKSCTATVAGTYVVIAAPNSDYTGAYGAFVQLLSNPVGAVALTSNGIVPGTVPGGGVDDFTFGGEANATVILTADKVLMSNLRVSVYDATGTAVCSASGYDQATAVCTMSSATTHSVFVSSDTYTSGTYELTYSPAPTLGATYPCNPVADPGFPSALAASVNAASGDYTHSTDIAIPGRGVPIDFTRTYHAGIPTVRALGKGWTHNWDMYVTTGTCSADATVHYPDGHAAGFSFNGSVYAPRPGVEDGLVKNVDNSWTLTTKHAYTYEFSAAGKLTSVRDRNGNTTTLAYDGSGNLSTVTDPGGRQLVFTTTSGKITQIALPLSRTVSFAYTGDELTSVTDTTSGTTTYTYSASGMTSATDPNSHTQLTQVFDGDKRVVEQTDALGGKTCFKYGWGATYTSTGCPAVSPAPNSSQTIVVDRRGNKTTYKFDYLYRTTEITNALGGVTQYTNYNGDHHVQTVTDPLNHTTTYTYDASGNMLTKTDPLNHVWTYTYNSFNQVLTATDPLTHVTTNAYDTLGNLTSVTDANAKVTSFTVNSAGLVTAVTDPLSHTTSYGYDSYGNRTTVTDALTNVWTYVFDLGGRITSVTDPLSHVTSYTYNNRDQVLTETNHLSQVTTTTYDTKGNRASVTDATSKVTSFAYDNADRLTSVVDPATQTESYVYDANGNRTSFTNVRSKTTSYVYDALNRRTSETDPLSNVTSFTYDAASRLTQRTDGRGLITKYFYDNADRLTSLQHRTAADVLVDTVSYAYDNANRRTSMTDPVGTTTYAYDVLDRTTSVTFPGASVVSYLYDDAGNRTRITYPDTKQVNYTYDAADRMATVTDWLTDQTSYAYDNAGRLTVTTYPNGVTAAVTYDNADRLLSVTNAKAGTFSSFTYTLDGVGNRTQMVATGAAAGTHSYSYDSLYRLTSVTYPGPTTHTYTYDAIGNRTAKNATTYTYDNADEMTAAGGVTYTYDANGNQTGRSTDTFTFDHENRMTQSVVGGVTSSSVYYGNGVRRSHTVNGATTSYHYDVLASLPVVIQDGTYSYVYGLDLISMTDGSGNQHYFSYDGLGSLSDLSDGTGTVTDTFAYDVFGAVTTRTGATPNVWKFTGEQADDGTGDSGYYYLRARHYDPGTGRFIGRDRLEFSQRYAYAGNNPVLMTDPSGLCRNPVSSERRPWWQRGLDALDCIGDADTAASNAVASAAVHCARDFNWLPDIGDCGARLAEASVGFALVVSGIGGVVIGCAGAIAIVGPPTLGIGAVAGCALAGFAGATVAYGGGVLFWNAFQPHGD